MNKLKASHFWAPCCKHPVSGDFLSLAHFILVQEEDKRKLFSQGDVYTECVTIDGILFPLLQYSVRDDKDKRQDSGVYTSPLLESKMLSYVCKK